MSRKDDILCLVQLKSMKSIYCDSLNCSVHNTKELSNYV